MEPVYYMYRVDTSNTGLPRHCSKCDALLPMGYYLRDGRIFCWGCR